MHFFMVRTSNMVRTFLSDRNSVSGSRSKKPDKQQIELHKRRLFPYLQAFLETLFMSSAWALSPSSIKHCYRHSRSRCPFHSAQICSKFLLLSFRMPSIFTRFLSRAEPPRETCWSWLYNNTYKLYTKEKLSKKRQTLVSSQPASQHSQPLGQSVGQWQSLDKINK